HDKVNREFYFYRAIEDMDGAGKQDNSPLRFPDHRGIAGWVKEHDSAVIINDVQADERVYNIQGIDSDFLTRSMICVPLRTRKGFSGVFYALNKQSGSFIERDMKLLEIMSGTIAVSLENGRLYGELKDHLHTLEQERHLLLSQAREKAGFSEIIGSSPPIRRMFALMDKVIAIPTTVLIRGETGTGKELIARVIHYNGPLSDKAFIAENCAALPENLLESELFGYVKGAFTGAVSDKKGLFEIADGGTIFLDEIGEMSLPMQVKLLRVLQEGQFRPVGGQQTKQVNVRLIASTNRNLTEEISSGNFREDLYYRINVFEIISPPLRERRDDIVHLASHFLEKFAQKYQKPVPGISPHTMDLLTRYNWPGNVRELENEMERAITMAAGRTFISPDLLSDKISPRGATGSSGAAEHFSGTLKEEVRHLEQKMIFEALENTRGNRSLAAKILGLSRQGLLNKIATYDVNLK
ncbi:MAG: sigma 54-interacting transcriptional regulator, partial [Desulfocapsaceae bacterium]|nr:sigma 54-interacting transcriptional regulator [Desulfocapsaceae bacterium]